MATPGLWRLSGAQLLEGYARREFSPVEALDDIYERIERLDPALHAFLALNTADARQAAKRAEAQWLTPGEKPPLLGLPVSVKDTFEMRGMPTTYGSLAFADNYRDDSELVHRLRIAGAVITGKTNTPEFALAGAVNGKLTAPPANPWDLERTAGFSSAGAASSVAAGLGPLALGTDSGGSVRLPAAHCGVYALKPTYQRIPAVQAWRAGPDRSHIGPITRTVRDSALLMAALAGLDPRDPDSDLPDEAYMTFASGNVRNKRVAFSPSLGGTAGPIDSEAARMAHDAADLLRDLGCVIIESDPPAIDTPEELEPGTWAYAGDHYHAAESMVPDFWEKHADDLTDQLRPVYETGRRALAWQYRAIIRRNRLFEQAMREWFKPFDYLLTPAVGPAPRIDSIPRAHQPRRQRHGLLHPVQPRAPAGGGGPVRPALERHVPVSANRRPARRRRGRTPDVRRDRSGPALGGPLARARRGPLARGGVGRQPPPSFSCSPSVILVLDTGIHAPALDPRLRGNDGGPRGDDVGVLRMSAAIEAAQPWAGSWPALAQDLSLARRRAAPPSVILVLDTGIHAPALDPRLRGNDGGPRGDDVGVLRMSAAIEAAQPWAGSWPALAQDLSLASG